MNDVNPIEVRCHLVVAQSFREGYGGSLNPHGRPSVRVSKGRPQCASDEVAIAINLSLPRSLFLRPNLVATISVPDNQAPITITPDMQSNIAKVVADQLGIVMQIFAPDVPGSA